MRLIDANEFIEAVHYCDEQQKNDVWLTSDIEYLLAQQPTVDAVPVVHGEWIWTVTGEEDRAQYWRCSECNDKSYIEHNYCPNCGAKMDDKGDDE